MRLEKAGWLLDGRSRLVLDDLISQFPEDSQMAAEFTYAKTTSGILVQSLEPKFAARVTSAIRQTLTGILSGTIRSGIHDQPYGDAKTVEQYRAALQELLKAIPSPEGCKSA